MVNKQLREEEDYIHPTMISFSKRKTASQDPSETLDCEVSSKLKEGYFKGVIHLACSEDNLAVLSNATICSHKEKHTSPPLGLSDCEVSSKLKEGNLKGAIHLAVLRTLW